MFCFLFVCFQCKRLPGLSFWPHFHTISALSIIGKRWEQSESPPNEQANRRVSLIYCSTEGPWGHSAKWNKPVIKGKYCGWEEHWLLQEMTSTHRLAHKCLGDPILSSGLWGHYNMWCTYTHASQTPIHIRKKETNTARLCSYGVCRVVQSIRREANGGCQRSKGRGNGDLPMDLRIPASQNESLWRPIANLKPGLSHQQPMSCMNSRMAINMAWHKYHTLTYNTMRFSFIFNDVFGMWLYGSWVWTCDSPSSLHYHTKSSGQIHFLSGWMTTLEPHIRLNLPTVPMMVTLRKRLLVPFKGTAKEMYTK